MLVYKISAARRPGRDEEQKDAFEALLGAYRLDGHILGRELTTAYQARRLEAYLLVPAADAFYPGFINGWIGKSLERLKKAGLSTPRFVAIGRDRGETEACACADPSSLILFTTYVQLQSPVRCGDCFLPLPLYRLPRFGSGEFVEVIAWADDYKACDSLFMNSATGERFGYREMSRFDSSLSRRGREICKHFENGTGKPTYYYLYRYYGRSAGAENARTCPGCGGQWLLSDRWNLFDFRCDTCRLVSNLAPSLK
jgi:predicted  nucleic acid-binding Zn ribbon protein